MKAIPAAHVSIDSETRIATPSDRPLPDPVRWQAVFERYLRNASALVPGAATSLHVAVCKEMTSNSDSLGRGIFLADDAPSLADAVRTALEKEVHANSHVVVFGSDTLDSHEDDDLRQGVASDLGLVFQNLYPVLASGPIAPVMPLVTQMAAFLLIAANRIGIDNETLKNTAMARVTQSLRRSYFPGEWNAALVHEEFPFLLYLLEDIADASLLMAQSPEAPPLTAAALAARIHSVIGDVIRSLGGAVTVK